MLYQAEGSGMLPSALSNIHKTLSKKFKDMGKITFSSDEARKRYVDCRRKTAALGDNSLYEAMKSLKRWTNPIVIGCDFDKMSFTFREQNPNGYCVNGGIIYHGPRDAFGSGEAPTFSVTIDEASGYRIHT